MAVTYTVATPSCMVAKPSHGRHLSGRSANSKSGRESWPRLPQREASSITWKTPLWAERNTNKVQSDLFNIFWPVQTQTFLFANVPSKESGTSKFLVYSLLTANPWRSHQHIPMRFPAFGFIWPEYSTVKLALDHHLTTMAGFPVTASAVWCNQFRSFCSWAICTHINTILVVHTCFSLIVYNAMGNGFQVTILY